MRNPGGGFPTGTARLQSPARGSCSPGHGHGHGHDHDHGHVYVYVYVYVYDRDRLRLWAKLRAERRDWKLVLNASRLRPPMGWLVLFALMIPDAGVPDAGVPAPRRFDPRWARIRSPHPGQALAIGQPGCGCVQGAVELPVRGAGWLMVHPERHRQFGHPALIAYLHSLAARARVEKLGPLYIGDLGQARGGPTPSGHRSHQNGLDVDVWYGPPAKPWKPGKAPVPPAPIVADLRTHKMLAAWGPKPASLIESAARDPAVDRIFVNPAVKRALCQDKTRRGPWLQRVRPWWGHHDHLHVRLRCPADSPDCVESKPLPAGDGCDNLDWWLSEDARANAEKRPPPSEPPTMPAACESLLQEPQVQNP